MKVIAALLALATVASAGVVSPLAYGAVVAPSIISRAPAFDSAVIKSDRLGGNFAYSVAENHAYAQHTPVIQHVTSAVGVSYSAGAPVVTGYSAPIVRAVAAPAIAAYSTGHIGYNAYNTAPFAYGNAYGYGSPAIRYL